MRRNAVDMPPETNPLPNCEGGSIFVFRVAVFYEFLIPEANATCHSLEPIHCGEK